MLKTLRAPPFNITTEALQARLALCCGDGALVAGGPLAKHSSTSAMEKIWEQLRRPPRVCWDFFHLLDVAGKKAMRTEIAVQFNTLMKELERLFGLGQGRHIDRCVTSFLSVKFLVCKSPCGTRKITYLCGIPERFVAKYKSFYCGLLVRMRQSLAGRGSRSFQDLRAIGETLSDIRIVVYAMVLMAVLKAYIAPLGNAVQDATAVPWERWVHIRNVLEVDLPHAMACLQKARVIFRLLVLVRPYLPKADMLRFWQAHLTSPPGKLYQVLYKHVHDMLMKGTMQGCDVIIAAPAAPPGGCWAHPCCQCPVRPRVAPGAVSLARGGGLVTDKCFKALGRPDLQGQVHMIPVPWWVGNSIYSDTALRESAETRTPLGELPRWQRVPADRPACKRLCKVPAVIVEALSRIDGGLDAGAALIQDLRTHMRECFIEGLGISADMMRILDLMSTAWWLPDVI
jgi:hypothetical protein